MVEYREIQHQSESGAWWLARMTAPSMLQPWVKEYVGYRECSPEQRLVRREIPSPIVGLIINFGSPFKIVDPRPDADWIARNTFIAGLHTRPAWVASDGNAHCLQIDFTPLGACRFFNSTLLDINHATTPLDDVLGLEGALWLEQLFHCRDWRRRFEVVNQFLLRRFARATQPRPEVERAWQLLRQSRGRVRIADLAGHLNRSREFCSRLIKNELGMAPKTLAKILRFDNVLQINSAGTTSLVDLALQCGYTDQSHFTSEIKSLSGYTPRQLFNHYHPDGGLLEAR